MLLIAYKVLSIAAESFFLKIESMCYFSYVEQIFFCIDAIGK